MPSVPLGSLKPETRKPSKARLLLAVLFFVLLVLSIVFISLYAVEKNKSTSENSPSRQQPHGTAPSKKTCNTLGCVVSAAGDQLDNIEYWVTFLR